MQKESDTITEKQPTILSYVKDFPNILSLSGLACTILAIYFIITGLYYAGMIGMIWAVAFDWADGLVARKIKGRTASDAKFGGQLDSFIDVVNFGVAPAILLLSFGKFEPIYLIGVFIALSTAVLRLSYFNVYGLSGGTKYTGLALDNNVLVLVSVFLLESILPYNIFSIILYIVIVGLAFLNVSEIKTPKLSGSSRNVYMLGVYTLGITAIYLWKLM